MKPGKRRYGKSNGTFGEAKLYYIILFKPMHGSLSKTIYKRVSNRKTINIGATELMKAITFVAEFMNQNTGFWAYLDIVHL